MNPNKPLTPEQEEDLKGRVEAFRKEYLELSNKYQVDFASFPQFVQNKDGMFGVIASMQMIDKKFAPVPSNFMKN